MEVNTFSRMCLFFHGWGESGGGLKGGVIFIKFRQFSVIGIQLKFLLVFKTFNERIGQQTKQNPPRKKPEH